MTAPNPKAVREAVERVKAVARAIRNDALALAGTPDAARQRLDYAADLETLLAAIVAKDEALIEIAKDALRQMMRDISETVWCAGWLMGLEYALWQAVEGSPNWNEIDAEHIATLKRLSDACDGWWMWRDGVGEIFIGLTEWRARVADRAASSAMGDQT